MTDSGPSSARNKRRKIEGFSRSVSSSAPADRDEERVRKSVAPSIQIQPEQDPRLLHYLDGHLIVRHSHLPFASGGFCDVCTGHHPTYGKVVMRRPRMTQAGYTLSKMTDFLAESEIWKKLHHPSILQFLGFIQSDGFSWAVSSFAENGSLPTYLKNHPGISRRALVHQLADAIRYLHRQEIIHGDIKGSNILVSSTATVLLSDFGLSKPSGAVTRSALSGAGSCRWCAPEVLFEEETKTAASDAYAFGMTVYEILSGNVPFYDLTSEVLVIKTISEGIRPPREPAASESGESYEHLWNAASESWLGNPAHRPTMEDLCGRLGVPAISSARTTEDTSVAEIMTLHSGEYTSTHAARRAARRFDQLAVVDVTNSDGQSTWVHQSSMGRGWTTTRVSAGIPSGFESRMEEEYKKKQEEAEKLISSLSRAHARYKDTSTKPSQPCHPGTRKTLLQNINSWINDEPSTLFFWLCGEVGVGKTTVAHTIAMEQDALGQLAASFFFNRDNDHRRDPDLFAKTIAYQLARFDNRVHQAVAAALRTDPDIAHLDLKEQFQQLVVRPLDCLAGSFSNKVVIVLDGLDECSNPALLLEILPLLTQLTGLHLRVLITSRPHAAIVTKFEHSRLYHLTSQSHFRNVNFQALNDDVKAYLEWSLGEIASEFSLPSPWPSPGQVNKLVSMASGLFVIASIFHRYIRDPMEGNPVEQLERILSRKKTVGGSPTAELDAMYDLVLEDVNQSLHKDGVDLARNVLQLAFLSSKRSESGWSEKPRGMSISQMADFLGHTAANVQSVLRRMTSVMRLPSGDGDYIIPFHASFGEYIQDPRRCGVTEFLMEAGSSHAELATKFLEFFLRTTEGGITGIEYDFNNMPPENLMFAGRELHYHLSSTSDPVLPPYRHAKAEGCRDAILIWIFSQCWDFNNDDRVFVDCIKEARLATACGIEDDASLQCSMVKHIISQTHHLTSGRSFPMDGGGESTHEESYFANEVNVQTFKIKLQWEGVFWTFSESDPRSFARMLWIWNRLEHPNIVPLRGIDLNSLLELSEGSTVHVALMSTYPTLKCNWYPKLLHAFRQNSEGAIKIALDVAHALQYLQETSFWGSSRNFSVPNFCVEDIVLSPEGKIMIHLLFLVHKDRADPSPTDAERRSLARQGFTYWYPWGSHQAPKTVWDFGCVIYEMMTGEPPLKRYHDLVMGDKLFDDLEPIGREAPLEAYRDLIKSVEMSATGCCGLLKGSHYWTLPETKPPWKDATTGDILQHRYQTAIRHLLNDLQAPEDLKDVIKACWVVDWQHRPPIQEIVARLTAILEKRRRESRRQPR